MTKLIHMKKSWIGFLIGMFFLSLIKLWLVEAQSVFVRAFALHDDALFLNLAQHLLKGEWLGPYDQFTLIKGPFYPMFIAGVHDLGVRLLFAQQFLYVFACWVLTAALIPAFKKPALLLIFFGVLLFTPVSYEISSFRVLREGIYTSLVLLVLGCAFGLALRPASAWTRLWPWAFGLGLSLSAFWLTREEGIWLLPSLGLIIALAVYQSKKCGFWAWKSRLALWLGGLAIPVILVWMVSAANLHNYGVFAKTEYNSAVFKSAYGSLTRVKAGIRRPQVPVTRKVRMNIYDVSPTFSELRPYLEGQVGKEWVEFGKKNPLNNNEILGGWFMWAFRDSVSHAGYYSKGKFPEDFYLRMTDEIDSACRKGQLSCYPPRSSMIPPFLIEDMRPLARYFRDDLLSILRYEALLIDCPPYTPDPDHDASIFARLTGEELCKTSEELASVPFPPPEREKLNVLKMTILHGVLDSFQNFHMPLTIIALPAYAALFVLQFKRKRMLTSWAVASILLVRSVDPDSFSRPLSADILPLFYGWVHGASLFAPLRMEHALDPRSDLRMDAA